VHILQTDQRLRGEATWENNSRIKAQMASAEHSKPLTIGSSIADDLDARRQALADKLTAEEAQLRATLQAPATADFAERRQNMLEQARQRAIVREQLRAQVGNEAVMAA
jgi:hypothetical protein